MNNNTESPFQEAVSVIIIVSILVAVGCYVAALQNVPVLASCLFWIAGQMYRWIPALSYLHGAQIPMLVSAATVGAILFLCAIPFAGLLAGAFSRAQLQSVERETMRLKRNRAKLVTKRRSRDDFTVS